MTEFRDIRYVLRVVVTLADYTNNGPYLKVITDVSAIAPCFLKLVWCELHILSTCYHMHAGDSCDLRASMSSSRICPTNRVQPSSDQHTIAPGPEHQRAQGSRQVGEPISPTTIILVSCYLCLRVKNERLIYSLTSTWNRYCNQLYTQQRTVQRSFPVRRHRAPTLILSSLYTAIRYVWKGYVNHVNSHTIELLPLIFLPCSKLHRKGQWTPPFRGTTYVDSTCTFFIITYSMSVVGVTKYSKELQSYTVIPITLGIYQCVCNGSPLCLFAISLAH